MTSAAALNPLPNKLAFELSLPRPASPGAAEDKSQQTEDKPPIPIELPPRPKKVLEEEETKPKVAEAGDKKADAQAPVIEKKAEEEVAPASKETESAPSVAVIESSKTSPAESSTASTPSTESKVDDRRSGSAWIGSSASSASSKDSTSTGGSDKVLTAIYKPESKEVWKKALQTANEQAEKVWCRDDPPVSCGS